MKTKREHQQQQQQQQQRKSFSMVKQQHRQVYLIIVFFFLSFNGCSSFSVSNQLQLQRQQQQQKRRQRRSDTGICNVATLSTTTTTTRTGTTSLSMSYKKNNKNDDKIREDHVALSTGVSMQVLSMAASSSNDDNNNNNKPVLVFLHGSFHGAWCWAEHYFDYFTTQGYMCVAPSWRGTSGTLAGDDVKKIPIQQHVADLQDLLQHQLPTIVKHTESQPIPVVLIAHSFGGLTLMKLLERLYQEEHQSTPSRNFSIQGVAFLCSVPPSGIGTMTLRSMWQSPRACWNITKGLAMRKVLVDIDLCRQLFFASKQEEESEPNVSQDDLRRYQQNFIRDTVAVMDVMDLSKQLPSKLAENGVASWIRSSSTSLPPRLVIGAIDDYIVDATGIQETATFLGVQQQQSPSNHDNCDSSVLVMVDSPHDIMLGKKWKNAAQALEEWLSQRVVLPTKNTI